ncbi:Glucan endo-1,3-beta-glucosidase 11 [Apostasia shenzhenica]|uniref:glucan endo-1,3-beta-D-glucosidase n=1 Tax=Apostasia shenzhenica TaxID=1088818 RepID=A0A2I0B9F0_9ASPA|nr:Glucan endo-1,3-beta-glucosidase 11 [Apostasia shenzhenica]
MAAFFFKLRSISIFLIFFFLLFSVSCNAAALGINYGQVANDLPSPDQVLRLLASLKVAKVRIYDTNPLVLSAFSDSGIDLIITAPNDAVAQLAVPAQALQWVSSNIVPYLPGTKISCIAVGNEVFTTGDPALMASLVPAMAGLRQALVRLGLDSVIHVSTANSLAVLSDSYPPSLGSFKPELTGLLAPLLRFLAETGSPFLINAYPYFAYRDDPQRIPLDFVLFSSGEVIDPNTGLRYDNMLYAQVDAVIFAISRFGFGKIEVRVSETGWPSKGDDDEIGATVENARIYNRNLVARQLENEGTPARPAVRLEVYLFALFNEDLKPGPTSERNYGLYRPDGTMAYNVGLSPAATSTASVSTLNSSAPQVRWYALLVCHMYENYWSKISNINY